MTFENPLRIDEVITMSLVYYFLGHCIHIAYDIYYPGFYCRVCLE